MGILEGSTVLVLGASIPQQGFQRFSVCSTPKMPRGSGLQEFLDGCEYRETPAWGPRSWFTSSEFHGVVDEFLGRILRRLGRVFFPTQLLKAIIYRYIVS